jgi:hypothetical protein
MKSLLDNGSKIDTYTTFTANMDGAGISEDRLENGAFAERPASLRAHR